MSIMHQDVGPIISFPACRFQIRWQRKVTFTGIKVSGIFDHSNLRKHFSVLAELMCFLSYQKFLSMCI